MSEYRTHLRESVEALRDAAQRVAEALDETAGLGKSTEADKGEAEERVAAPVTVDATPAPSSPLSGSAPLSGAGNMGDSGKPDARRWWLNMYGAGSSVFSLFAYRSQQEADTYANREDPFFQRVEVVPAAALDAMREERDQAIHEQHVANDHLASLRRVIAKRGPEMQALDEAIRDRGCYDPALTVAQNALAYINQLGEWLDQRTNSANALLVERDTAIRERNEEIVKLSLCQIGRKHAQEERAAANRELRDARRLTPEVFEQACKAFRCAGITRQSVADSLRAALLAAGFQEDEA